jgi:cation transport ATPase
MSILHETPRRLRWQAEDGGDLDALAARVRAVPGVGSVRSNRRLGCLTIQLDGRPVTRAALLQTLHGDAAMRRAKTTEAGEARVIRPAQEAAKAAKAAQARGRGGSTPQAMTWAFGALAAALPLLPAGWRAGGALSVVATRVIAQRGRWRREPIAVLLDAASLGSLAVNGQPLVVSASVLLRLLAEGLSQRFVLEADRLLTRVLPELADGYRVLRDPGESEQTWPLRQVRAGDHLRLYPGDTVPVEGCVSHGSGRVQPMGRAGGPVEAAPGSHLAAGDRVVDGTFELRAEADAATSRLARLRAHVSHAINAREPAAGVAVDLERAISLPLTGAALVLGLTGDRARAAAMLQADPQRGLDLALPVAREAALLALARGGLVGAGLEAIERLAKASTLVLQDTGVLAGGRWTLAQAQVEAGGDSTRLRAWLAEMAGQPPEALERGGLPDMLVRQWVRHGAMLRIGSHEVHLAAARRLHHHWGLALPVAAADTPLRTSRRALHGLQRRFGLVTQGRLIGHVVLISPWRESLTVRVRGLRALGFERVAVFAEDDGARGEGASAPSIVPGAEHLADDLLLRSDWLAQAAREGAPVVLVHSVLRDLVPPGSLSLTTAEAEVGAHGVLLGDPLAALLQARRAALRVQRRLRLHHGAAVGTNALLMSASALRWWSPIVTTLMHHGFGLIALLDSLRLAQADTVSPDLTNDQTTR